MNYAREHRRTSVARDLRARVLPVLGEAGLPAFL